MNAQPTKLSKQGIRTKSHIKKAFISLINEQGYSHVTVTDIVNRAQYNRATFYLYYLDKQHATEEIRTEMFNELKRTSIDRYKRGEMIRISKMHGNSFELLHFIYANQDFFNLYLKKDTIPNLHLDLPKAIGELLEENFVFIPAADTNIINSSAHKLYMAHGTAGIILDWIAKGYSLSPEEVSLQLIEILQSFARSFTIINTS